MVICCNLSLKSLMYFFRRIPRQCFFPKMHKNKFPYYYSLYTTRYTQTGHTHINHTTRNVNVFSNIAIYRLK